MSKSLTETWFSRLYPPSEGERMNADYERLQRKNPDYEFEIVKYKGRVLENRDMWQIRYRKVIR